MAYHFESGFNFWAVCMSLLINSPLWNIANIRSGGNQYGYIILDTTISIAFRSKYTGHQWLKSHPLICVTHGRLHFYFDPEKLWHPSLQTPYISSNLLAKYSSFTFPRCFCHIVGICSIFLGKRLRVASQCLLFPYIWGAARWCVWRSTLDPAWGRG